MGYARSTSPGLKSDAREGGDRLFLKLANAAVHGDRVLEIDQVQSIPSLPRADQHLLGIQIIIHDLVMVQHAQYL